MKFQFRTYLKLELI